MNVFIVIEEWCGEKRRKKREDSKVIGVWTTEKIALARANRMRAAGRRMKLKNYVVRIEEHELREA